MTSFTTEKTFGINDTIHEVHFLDTANTLVLAFCQNALIVVNLTSGTQYSMPPINAASYDVDDSYNIYYCLANTLTQLKI
jgi:hypothetical protein